MSLMSAVVVTIRNVNALTVVESKQYFKIDADRMSVGNIMDILKGTRKAPKDYRMD
jgi:hypothetical protein